MHSRALQSSSIGVFFREDAVCSACTRRLSVGLLPILYPLAISQASLPEERRVLPLLRDIPSRQLGVVGDTPATPLFFKISILLCGIFRQTIDYA